MPPKAVKVARDPYQSQQLWPKCVFNDTEVHKGVTSVSPNSRNKNQARCTNYATHALHPDLVWLPPDDPIRSHNLVRNITGGDDYKGTMGLDP